MSTSDVTCDVVKTPDRYVHRDNFAYDEAPCAVVTNLIGCSKMQGCDDCTYNEYTLEGKSREEINDLLIPVILEWSRRTFK